MKLIPTVYVIPSIKEHEIVIFFDQDNETYSAVIDKTPEALRDGMMSARLDVAKRALGKIEATQEFMDVCNDIDVRIHNDLREVYDQIQ